MSDAKAEIEITASTARLPAALQRAMSMFQRFTTGIGNAIKSSPLSFAKTVGGEIGHSLVRGTVYRGLDLMIAQGKEFFDFSDKLTRFGIAARLGGTALDGVGRTMRQTSSDTGLAANEVLRGARAYVDLAGAGAYTTDKMSLIARAAQASGSDINDMATVVYALQHSLGIPNTQLEDTIGGLINLSKDGAVHFNQMAQELIGLAPVYAQFGIKGREGAIQLASQLEVVRTGFGSASEAGTGLLRLYRSIPQHAKLLEGAGVQIFQKGSRTDLLTLGEILKNIKGSRLEKDRPALIKAFGRGEAERSYQLLDKLLNEYEKLEEAGLKNGVVQQDLATYTESAAGRMNIAIEHLKNKIADVFTPERIDKFVVAIEEAAEKVVPLVDGIAKIGEILGGLYSAGKAIRGAFTSDDSRISASSPEEIEGNAKAKGISIQQSALDLEAQHGSYLNTKRQIAGLLREGEYPTKESDKAAVAAGMTPETTPGFEGARQAAQSYKDATGMSPQRFHELEAQARKEATDSAIAAGHGRSASQEDMVDAFNTAIKQTLAPEVSRAIVEAVRGRPSVVSIDGHHVAAAADNSNHSRRR